MTNKLTSIKPQRANANKHTQRGLGMLEQSIQRDGWIGAITVAADGESFDGSARIEVGVGAGFDDAIVVRSDGSRPVVLVREDIPNAEHPRAKRLGVAANRVASVDLEWDTDVLAGLNTEGVLDGLFYTDELEALLASVSGGSAGEGISKEQAHKTLAERFIVPPFSVLDARQGYWQERKRAWIALGIQSELGRGEGVAPGDALEITEPGLNYYRNRTKGGNGRDLARKSGQDLMRGKHTVGDSRRDADKRSNLTGAPSKPEWATGTGTENMAAGTSIFDPVLCELIYRWFCPPSGYVLDPFAGGSVRGITAARLGLHYTGVDLSDRQIEANREQAARIVPNNPPAWVIGDSRDITSLAPGAYDLLFSCPPYGDLEVYSDDSRDLSTLKYQDFIREYRRIIADSLGMLKPDRFACFTVGDIRDQKGMYRNFVSDTISAFQDAGASLYNEAILVTAAGSLPIRVGKQFSSGRKLGKTHQNVLVFVKGDPKRATLDCGPVEVSVIAEAEEC